MPPTDEAIDETTDTTTDVDAADETPTGVSPADDESSSSASATEEEVDAVEETPEQKVEREKTERKAARVKAAEDAERRAESARKERQRKREENEAVERAQAREAHANELIEKANRLYTSLQERAEAVRRGGPDALKALGIEYGDWTKKYLEENGPDAVAQRALSRIDQLEAEIRKRDEQDRNARAQAQQQRTAEESAQRFEKFAEDSSEDYPHAPKLTSRMFRILADEAAAEYMRENGGRHPSFNALLPRLDKKAKEFHDELSEKNAKQARSGVKSSDDASNTQAKPNGQSASAPANRTLSNAAATTKASAKRPPTPEEEDEWALNELRQAMAADSKAQKTA